MSSILSAWEQVRILKLKTLITVIIQKKEEQRKKKEQVDMFMDMYSKLI